MIKANNKGQTLIEALVATAIVALVLTAIVSGVTLSVKNSRFSKDQALATRYTQEAIESIRFYRDDAGWTSFYNRVSAGGTMCFNSLPADTSDFLTNYTFDICVDTYITGTRFMRQVTFTPISATEISIEVNVTWEDGGNQHQSTSTTVVTDWDRS